MNTISEKSKHEFIHFVSHEFKAPVRAIDNLSSWSIESLDNQELDELHKYLELIQGKSKLLNRMLDDTCRYALFDPAESNPEKVSVYEVICKSVKQSNITIPVEIDEILEKVTSLCDKSQLSLVFDELFSNIQKHSNATNAVVEGEVRQEAVTLTVCDNGVGIDKKFNQSIFEEYVVLQPRDRMPTTGLGLSLVKKIILNEGQSIWVDDLNSDGFSVSFTWPYLQA